MRQRQQPKEPILMLFSKEIAKLDLKTAAPYNQKDLIIFATPNLAFRITGMMNESGERFLIKPIMEDHEVFACPSFDDRLEDFAKIMNTRLERYFLTGKTSYVFFDEEEQKKLRQLLSRNTLNANVSIYMRAHVAEGFREQPYLDLSVLDHADILRHLKRIKPMMLSRPELYYQMHNLTEKRKEKHGSMRNRREGEIIEPIKKRYSAINAIEDSEALTYYQRVVSKALHPDKMKDDRCYAYISIDFEDIEDTRWFAFMKQREKQQEKEEPQKQEESILSLSEKAGDLNADG